MKTIVVAGLVAIASLAGAPAWAHGGDKPRHGGVVQAASELSFELAGGADGAVIYVEDHGKPLPTAGMSGKLIVLQGSGKSEAELAPAGDNRLAARGIRLAAGAKVVATLSTAQKKAITVRFTVR